MMLVALGYKADVEGLVGANWELNTNTLANKEYLFDGLSINSSEGLTRDNAAQMVYNGIQKDMVTYNAENEATKLPDTTIVGDKYGVKTGYGILTNTTYDSDKDEYHYTFKNTGAAGEQAPASFTTNVDYSELFGMNCKVVYKDVSGKIIVFGVFYVDSAIILSGVVSQVTEVGTSGKSFKLNGVNYKIDGASSVAALPSYAFNSYQSTSFSSVPGCFEFDMLDTNDDGRIDHVVYYPFSVGKVNFADSSYATASTVFGSSIGSFKFKDADCYAGIAKNDFISVTPAANTVSGKPEISKTETISGEVTKYSSTSPAWVTIGGQKYYLMPRANVTTVGQKYETIVTKNGHIFPDSTPPVCIPTVQPLPVAVLTDYEPDEE